MAYVCAISPMVNMDQIHGTERFKAPWFNGLPTIVTKPGQYKTRSGQTVTIERIQWCDWVKHPNGVIVHGVNSGGYNAFGKFENGEEKGWDINGRSQLFGGESQDDLVGPA